MGVVDLDVVSSKNTSRTVQKAEELRTFMYFFDIVVYAHNHVVASSCLPARQHTPHSQSIHDLVAVFRFFEGQSLDAPLHCFGEDGDDFLRDAGVSLDSLDIGLE